MSSVALSPAASAGEGKPLPHPLQLKALELDCAREVERIASRIFDIVGSELHRRGAVIGVSGGIDSSVCAALCARALGPDKVQALLMPERDSSPDSIRRGRAVVEATGIRSIEHDVTPVLEALGAYAAGEAAIRSVVPGYGPGWKSKVVIGGGAEGRLNFFSIVVESPGGERIEQRLPHREYLALLAAQSCKQRARKLLEYTHADRLHYAVIGTPNRLEYDQGFFVKGGDGAADLKPIAHLYKTQVYALARHLGLPPDVCSARPTTDTFSLDQGQDEFYFALPYEQMDLALFARNRDLGAAELAAAIGVSEERARFVYRDIDAKRAATRYLHARPVLVEAVREVGT